MQTPSRSLSTLITRAILTLLFATVFVPAFALGTSSSASASEADCQTTFLASNGRELFTPSTDTVPPALRSFNWDCVSRQATFESKEDDLSRTYIFVLTNTNYLVVVDILKAFERDGWINGPVINGIDPGSQSNYIEAASMTADELAAVQNPPEYVRARFSDARTGNDVVELTFTDGTTYQNDSALNGSSIFVTLISNRYYSAQDLAEPSVLSSLRTIAEAAPSPTQTVVVCTASVILMLIVGYPSTLLNSVIGARYEQFIKWLKKAWRSPVKRKSLSNTESKETHDLEKHPEQSSESKANSGWHWLIWPGFVLAAIAAGFVDPEFGFNQMSLRMLATGFVSFAIFNLVGWAIVTRVVKRIQPNARPFIEFRWGSLVILVVAVLIARLLSFSPGVIFGLVSGLSFAVALTSTRKAITILVGSGYALAVSLLGWIGYSLLAPLSTPGNVALVTLVEFLSGVTIEGIATLPIALLPLAALDGAKLLKWKKWVWGASYAIGLAAFALVLFTIPDSFATYTGDFLVWTLLFVGFSILAVAVWALDFGAKQRSEKRKQAGEPVAP